MREEEEQEEEKKEEEEEEGKQTAIKAQGESWKNTGIL